MKKLTFLFAICILLLSCEKSNELSPGVINTEFNTKILDGYFIQSIGFDKQGNAWIGTFKQGLIKYNAQGVTVYNSTNSMIADTSVIYDLAIDSKNNVWIACEGLIKYDGTNFTRYNSSNTPMPEDFVTSVEIDSKDNVWFSSCRFRQGGLVKYNGTDWTVYTPDNSDLPVHFVQSIAIDKNDNVWLALNEVVNDSYLAKIANGQWTIYTSAALGFKPYYFGNIQLDSKNRLCGAIDYSLSSTAYNDGAQVFIFDGKASESPEFDKSKNVKFLTVDKHDNIWCGLDGGYAVFNGEKWTVEGSRFKENGVFAIEQSNDGKMWIGTGNGIYINE